jgi:hypothetical protein
MDEMLSWANALNAYVMARRNDANEAVTSGLYTVQGKLLDRHYQLAHLYEEYTDRGEDRAPYVAGQIAGIDEALMAIGALLSTHLATMTPGTD